MSGDAYQLLWDDVHLSRTDDQYDLTLEQEEQYAQVPQYWPMETTSHPLPEPVIFAANFGQVRYTHYPSNSPGWPVLSRVMLNTLLAVGAFPHRAIPVAVVDPVVYTPAEHELGAALLAERLATADHSYVIVQLTTHTELDEVASGVNRDPDLPWMVEVERYVFREPEVDRPPLFRLAIDPSRLYVSAAGRAALRAAGLAGPRYLPLTGYEDGAGDEQDVPVPEPTVG